jgi:hypothetical protein
MMTAFGLNTGRTTSRGVEVTDAMPAVPGLVGDGTADAAYPSGHKVLAVVLLVIAPLISLIAALVLRSSQTNPVRRATLQAWAIASGVWLGVGALIVIIFAASVGSGVANHAPSTSGPCQGGPVMGSAGVSVGDGNYRFPCADGGSTVVHLGQ